MYKKFNVTFTETKKYNPSTRTIVVHADDELHARELVTKEFDSFTYNKQLMIQIPSGKHIKITKVKEIKEKKK